MSLLEYQKPHVEKLDKILRQHKCAIDASDTGTGKTYAAGALVKQNNWKPIIICPKAVLMTWKNVLDTFEIEYLGICNYELINRGSWFEYDAGRHDTLGDKVKCPYLTVKKPKGKGSVAVYEWDDSVIDNEAIFIFDEVHRCKNKATVNSRILLSTNELPARKLLLSATIADKPEFFAVFSVMLGFCADVEEYRLFAKKIYYGGDIKSSKDYIAKTAVPPQDMLTLHKLVFPAYGARMKISELGDAFPSNRLIADTYVMDDDTVKAIQEAYQYISIVSKEAQERENNAPIKLVEMIRARQKIEALKVKTMVELTQDAVDDGNSVVVFVNYLDTMSLLVNELHAKCVIKGGQSIAERQRMIDQFQSDQEHIIICQIQSGGVGISLHDTIGDRPRISIISPSWSAQDLMQTFGRVHRAKGKTPCIQKLVYCHGTIEDHICKIVNQKIINYSHLNDGAHA